MPVCGDDKCREFSHSAYDFHWLRLDQFRSLNGVRIWIAATGWGFLPEAMFDNRDLLVAPTDLAQQTLQVDLSGLGQKFTVTISTPLASVIGPQEGWVDDVAATCSVRIWKRDTGAKYYRLGSDGASIIHTSPEGYAPPLTGNRRGLTEILTNSCIAASCTYPVP